MKKTLSQKSRKKFIKHLRRGAVKHESSALDSETAPEIAGGLRDEVLSGQCPLSLHLQADLYSWLSFCCATLCSTKFEQGLMHKDARNQIREIPAFTLRTAEKGMRQGYHDSTIRRCSSKEENTRQTSSEICPGSRRSSLSLETELISVLLILYLYNINIDVSSVFRVRFE